MTQTAILGKTELKNQRFVLCYFNACQIQNIKIILFTEMAEKLPETKRKLRLCNSSKNKRMGKTAMSKFERAGNREYCNEGIGLSD